MNHPPNDHLPLADYRWLISDDARPYLERATVAGETSTRLAKSLRQELTTGRTHLVLQQVELRHRARAKFQLSDRMFFTQQTLEQATGEPIARYKASRFATHTTIADLCCGIGGDLLSLAEKNAATGVDRDPVVALLANTNCLVHEISRAETITADALDVQVERFTHWHIDPDRRSNDKRFSNPEFCEPGIEFIDKLLSQNENGAIKLAPAAVVPTRWSESAELEWIGQGRECKQQIAWFGHLARDPGKRAATVIRSDAAQALRIVGETNRNVPIAARVGDYIFEPHAAVLAARLDGHMASLHGLSRVALNCAYLTADKTINEPLFTSYRVNLVEPFDLKRLKATLRSRGIGRVEVKKRGVDVEPAQIRKALSLDPSGMSATLILFRGRDAIVAVLAEPSDQ